jgi:Coenzyme PQQ synthesis protein D (PqqD)
MTETSIPCKASNVVERSGEELLLFHTGLGSLFEVNETGKRIWHLCDGRHSVQLIAQELVGSSEPRNPINGDVARFVRKLSKLGLLATEPSKKGRGDYPKKRHKSTLAKSRSAKRERTLRYAPPSVKEVWTEKSATSGVFLVEM